MTMNRIFIATTLLAASLLVGCRVDQTGLLPGRNATHPVTGVITQAGLPVEGATVMFFSEKLKITAYGKTDATGHYSLTTYEPDDGAPEGHYQVSIKKSEHKIVRDSEDPAIPPQTSTTSLLPDQYGDYQTSQLRAVVAAGRSNVFSYNLMP